MYPIALTRAVVLVFTALMAERVWRTSTYRALSGFPKEPNTFDKATSLDHQRVFLTGARRLCLGSLLSFSQMLILW